MKLRRGRYPQLCMYSGSLWVRLVTFSVFFFLYMPIFVLILFSFNDSRRNIVWRGFTLKYYYKAFENEILIQACINSLTIAFFSTIFSLALGVFAAYALWQFRFSFKWIYEITLTVPLFLPEVCVAVAMMLFFSEMPFSTEWVWPFHLSPIIISHISFTFPFATLIIRARLSRFNVELQQAAFDLGATFWQALRTIVLPFLKPAIFSAACLSFMLSLDDFIIAFFTSSPETITFPLKVYSMVRFSITPEVNAISSLLLAATALLAFFALLYQLRIDKKL